MAESGPTCLVLSQDQSLVEELEKSKLTISVVDLESKLVALSRVTTTEMAVVDATGRQGNLAEIVRTLHQSNKQMFICVYGAEVGRNPASRLEVADNGGAMTTWSSRAVREAADIVHSTLQGVRGAQQYICPYCHKSGLSEDGLWAHCPMYHLNEANVTIECPVCKKIPKQHLQVHIRNCHGPVGRGEIESELHDQVSIYAFGLVVCQREDGKLLLVQEKRNVGFWVPGGHLNPGEGLIAGAKREMMEEAGIEIDIVGVLKIEYLPTGSSRSQYPAYVRMRCVFLARPLKPEMEAKSIPDFESVGATWVSLDEMKSGLRLRSFEPLYWAEYMAAKKPVFPLEVLDTV